LGPDDRGEIGGLELAGMLLKRWKLVIGLPVASAILAAGISLLIPARYTAHATFVPEGDGGEVGLSGGLSSFAAQFGVSVPQVGGNSPPFYAAILESRTIRDDMLTTYFPDPRTHVAGDSAELLDILQIRGETSSRQIEEGRKQLADRVISVVVNSETGVLTVSAETPYRQLSAEVANQLIDLLNQFNLETRQSTAKQRRQFIQDRVQEAERDLRTAEESLKQFLEGNRRWQNSAELLFEHDRHQRQVLLKQQVLAGLQHSYEDARIQEVNDAPVITVIDRAVAPDRKSSPRRRLAVLLAFFLGGVLSVSGAFMREFLERARERDSPGYRQFAARWAAAKAEIRGMFFRGGRSR
jgi:uncharacterized protein involved in exopolysaccharide biosynthesis